MSGSGATVSVRDLSRAYGDVVALQRVSFDLFPGVTGLLGPNGAGKTSLIRVLVGHQSASQGQAWVYGKDPRGDPEVYRQLGYVPEAQALPDALTARRFVRSLAVQRSTPDPDDDARFALELCGLDPDLDRPLRTYSKGMRQRTKIAAAIVHKPWVLVLDEPLNGLDPIGRVEIMDLLTRLGNTGVTVMVSSHVLHEVQRLAPRVLVMVQGRIAAEGSPRDIRDLMDDRPTRIRVRADDARRLGAVLLGEGTAERVEVRDVTTLVIDTTAPAEFRRRLAVQAREADVVLAEVTPLDDDLDSIFAYLVGGGAS